MIAHLLLAALSIYDPVPQLVQMQKSYVNVATTYKKGGDWYHSAGSGVVLAVDAASKQSTVLTCAHVIDKPGALVFVAAENADTIADPLPAIVGRVDVDHDLALLIVNGIAGEPISVAAKESARWSQVWSLGDAAGAGAWGVQGVVSSRIFMLAGQRYWRLSMPVVAGMSGGPVVNAKGELVCLVAAALASQGAANSNLGLCVPLDTIRTFLRGADKPQLNWGPRKKFIFTLLGLR